MVVNNSLNRNDPPSIVVEGMDEIIRRDLEKVKALLERKVMERLSFVEARSHEIKRKRYYNSLIGGGKYNDDSLRSSIKDIGINIRHLSDKVQVADEEIKFNTHIVDTLTRQLEEYNIGLNALERWRRENPDANTD